MAILKQSTAYTRMFMLIASSDHITGLTSASPTVTLSKAGAAFGAVGGTVTEVSNGWYKIAFNTTDTNTLGDLAVHITAASADPTDFVDQVAANILGDTLPANVTQWNGTNVSAPATAGIPEVNVKNINNVAASSVTTVSANIGTTQPVNYTGTGASALVKSDMVDVAGAAVSTSSAQIGVNAVNIGGTAQTGRDLGASVLLSAGTGTGQLDFTSGVVKANVTQWLGGTIPAVNVTGVPLIDLKYTLGTISPATAGSVRADAVTGAVGSVTGAVGSVTGAVGSVTGNVGGNVVGSVASVTAAVALTAAYDAAKTASQAGDAMALTAGERNSTADALLDRAAGIETALTPRQGLRLFAAALLGKASGLAGATAVYRDTQDSKNRISATVDANGNRSAVTLDAS